MTDTTKPMQAEQMRAEFYAWVRDQGCDTDGAWSAWQGCWNRWADEVEAAAAMLDANNSGLKPGLARAAEIVQAEIERAEALLNVEKDGRPIYDRYQTEAGICALRTVLEAIQVEAEAHPPAQASEERTVRFDVLYEIAATFGLDYNAVCKCVNAAMKRGQL